MEVKPYYVHTWNWTPPAGDRSWQARPCRMAYQRSRRTSARHGPLLPSANLSAAPVRYLTDGAIECNRANQGARIAVLPEAISLVWL
jgi:hypothetical protein